MVNDQMVNMKKTFLACLLVVVTAACTNAAPPLVYFGDTLEWNTDWVKRQCGTLDIEKNIIEVSGIACSRVTPGYIWMQSDETVRYIIATDEKGADRACKVKFDKSIRWDWEDMSGGVYEGKNYLFIGAFGDNDETDGNYSVVYFEEPAINPQNAPEITITPQRIKYVYPDGKNHNNEALMYDNREQMIYIITKVYYDVCQVFSLPFRLDYGDETQTLTYVCDLGVRSDLGEHAENKPYKGFHLVTGADISPDGKYILIKNHNNIVSLYCWVLLWERQDGESVAETLIREKHPQPIKAYNTTEWQGEAICWLDSTTFYTTSDADDGNPPIFKFTKKAPQGVLTPDDNRPATTKVLRDGQVFILRNDRTYTLLGQSL
jgi:hypothetical protein